MKFTEYYFKENDITTNPNFMNWFKGSQSPLNKFRGLSCET